MLDVAVSRYSFANPAIASGLLMATTNMSYAQYLDTHVFPVLGIKTEDWRWLVIAFVTQSLLVPYAVLFY